MARRKRRATFTGGGKIGARIWGSIAVAGLLASACGLPLIGQNLPTTAQLINGAAASMANATGFEVAGAFTQGSYNFAIDMQVNMPATAHIKVERNSLQVEVIQAGGKVYYRSPDMLNGLLGTTAVDRSVERAVGDRWYTYKDAQLVDTSPFTDGAKVKANFFNTLAVKRKDNVSSGGVMTAELSADDFVINITESSPHRLVFVKTAPGQFIQDYSDVHMVFSNYNQDFAIQAPGNVFDMDDHTTWPPLYYRVSINNARCDYPCTLSAVFQNDGGTSGASSHSTVTFTVADTNQKVLGSCAATIHPDVPYGQKVTETCTISSAAWNSYNGTYYYDAVVDNPGFN